MSNLRTKLMKSAEELNIQQTVEELVQDQKNEVKESQTLNDSLYKVMSSFDIFYRQIKYFHWIIKGENYIATHRFLDEIADVVREKIDLIAERLVFLNFIPEYEMNSIVSKSDVKYKVNPTATMNEIINTLLDHFDVVLENLKDAANKSQYDYGTQQFITEVIYDIEVYKHHIESFQ